MRFETPQEIRERQIREAQNLKLEDLVVPGRSLPKGMTYIGHDIAGRGKAAGRRLRQIERNGLNALKRAEAAVAKREAEAEPVYLGHI